MYARSITIMGDPERLDEGIAYVRDEVMPTITALDGCVGLSMLVDRGNGQCIVTSSWETQEAMRASDVHLAPMRRRGGEIMGGPPRGRRVGGGRHAPRPRRPRRVAAAGSPGCG